MKWLTTAEPYEVSGVLMVFVPFCSTLKCPILCICLFDLRLANTVVYFSLSKALELLFYIVLIINSKAPHFFSIRAWKKLLILSGKGNMILSTFESYCFKSWKGKTKCWDNYTHTKLFIWFFRLVWYGNLFNFVWTKLPLDAAIYIFKFGLVYRVLKQSQE